MNRSQTPSIRQATRRLLTGPTALKLCGTLTVVSALAWAQPSAVEAQAIGTLQVKAEVSRADAAWSGLEAAQQLARELEGASAADSLRWRELPLARTELLVPAPAPTRSPPFITIQYLHN
jgi:hypothetical protein